MSQNKNTIAEGQFLPEIRKGRVKTLTIHEISETELNILAQGSPNTIYLNFAIGLFTLAASFLISILTTKIESDRVYMTFEVIAIIGFISSIFLFILWKKDYKSNKKVVEEIRKRLPPEGESKSLNTKT
ncbi:MAG: hypothetical protein M1480_01655 [Bacteroidetes bacterium]|nr:hypothetical protein [Bacteroidota bacterium]